jgi:Mn2+/Fe2+ NRAMP family transporter
MDYSPWEIIFIVIFVGVTLVSVISTIIAVIDIIKSDFPYPPDKKKWLIVVVATGIVGATVYYFVGRKERFIHDK